MNYEYEASYLESPDAESWPDFESYDFYESYDAEARPRGRPRRPPPVKPATGAPAFRPRPAPGGASGSVTQAQLEAALARVRQQITANANAIKTIDGRVRTVISDTQKLQAMTKKDVDKLRAELKTTQTLSALIPLIAPPGSAFGQVAPLLHLMGGNALTGGTQGAAADGSLLGGSTNNLLTIGALVYASGVLDPKHQP